MKGKVGEGIDLDHFGTFLFTKFLCRMVSLKDALYVCNIRKYQSDSQKDLAVLKTPQKKPLAHSKNLSLQFKKDVKNPMWNMSEQCEDSVSTKTQIFIKRFGDFYMNLSITIENLK